MPNTSFLAKSVILASAMVGGLVGLFELNDRFGFMASEPTRDGGISKTTLAGSNGTGGQSGTTSEAAVEVEGTVTDEGADAPVPAPAEEEPAVTALERDVAVRVSEQLERLDCAGVTVKRVQATANTVPEEETSHGFEGHLFDGSVVLAGDGGPERIVLKGSGKGPTGAVSAVDMALRGFDEQLRQTDIFNRNCKGD